MERCPPITFGVYDRSCMDYFGMRCDPPLRCWCCRWIAEYAPDGKPVFERPSVSWTPDVERRGFYTLCDWCSEFIKEFKAKRGPNNSNLGRGLAAPPPPINGRGGGPSCAAHSGSIPDSTTTFERQS